MSVDLIGQARTGDPDAFRGQIPPSGDLARSPTTRANGQPAFALYVPGPDGAGLQAIGLLVVTLTGSRIAAITRFEDGVPARFGLPLTLPA